MEDGNGNVVSVEKVVDKKELAKQRRAFLQRERRHAEKLIRERQKQIDFAANAVVNKEDEHESASMGDLASNAVELAKQRNTMLRRERRNALKRSSVDICSDEEDLVRKQKRNEEQRERYDADKRYAQHDEDKEREKKFLLLSL